MRISDWSSDVCSSDLPPGFLDKGKADKQRAADNRYGDLIIWREILDHVRTLESGSVVLLTNDNKQDWVYTPPTVIEENGRPQGNDGRNGLKVIDRKRTRMNSSH